MVKLSAGDRLDLIELQNSYAWGIDGKDAAQFEGVFTDDVDAQYTTLMRLQGRARLARWLESFHAPYDATQHLFSNFTFTSEGDGVLMRSYVVAQLFVQDYPGGANFVSHGYYLDRVVQADAGWRVRSRQIINLWREGNVGLLDVGRRAVENSVPGTPPPD
jgi:SnoaL-like domain